MSTTTDEKNMFRSLAAVLGIGGLALFGATACDDSDDAAEDDTAVEEEENGAEDPAEDDAAEDDAAEDDAAEDPMEEDEDTES